MRPRVGGSPRTLRTFDRVFLPWMRRRLDVRIAGLPRELPSGIPLILVANHVSWWDGFLLREVHRALRPASPLHPVMLASELSRRWVLRALGGVGIDAGSPGTITAAIRTLRERIERHPETVVIFFPQGRIWPSHRRPLGFHRGIELFARRLAPATVLPVAIHIEPLHRVAPTAFLLAGAPVSAGSSGRTAPALQSSIEKSLDALHHLLSRRGEAALAEWPAPFETLEDAE